MFTSLAIDFITAMLLLFLCSPFILAGILAGKEIIDRVREQWR
jgi:hypothetical protein